MKKITIGILAHVDAGKTTLSEALLYRSGAIRNLGRVDHGDAFLDTDDQEKTRGITIFSKTANISAGETTITLVDTPGHTDFSMEMERALPALDYAIVVISGPDGPQPHTETLWRLLEAHGVPTFLFVNKMDQPGTDQQTVLTSIQKSFGPGCVDFGVPEAELQENAAVCDDILTEKYLEGSGITDGDLSTLIAGRKLFPCFFGSALKLQGIDTLLDALDRYTDEPVHSAEFAARVFRISRDDQGNRLTWLKITGGTLSARETIQGGATEPWLEKVNQIRAYSGKKFVPLASVDAGSVVAVTGLSRTRPGEGLGVESDGHIPMLEPVLSYRITPAELGRERDLLDALRKLEEEDPSLRVNWNEALGEVHLRLMGEIQQSVISRQLLDRFGLEVGFDSGSILYKETIAAPVRGVGHFEPLRHYAEVHVLLEPLAAGSGLLFERSCEEALLDNNWQKVALSCLRNKTHLGVLTRSPVTDVRITLTGGAYSEVHSEGGDFREAASRAVRNALRQAQNVLLEPWYAFSLMVPQDMIGRAMSDMLRMHGRFEPAGTSGGNATLTGYVPVSEVGAYWTEVASYTGGRGSFSCAPAGYEPCHNSDEIVAAVAYDPDRDEEEPCGSIFCSHGAGFYVSWDKVRSHCHVKGSRQRQECASH